MVLNQNTAFFEKVTSHNHNFQPMTKPDTILKIFSKYSIEQKLFNACSKQHK